MDGRAKIVVGSQYYEEHLIEILEYGVDMFGYAQAKKYFDIISQFVERLGNEYNYHPECRYLATKSRKYRNIILDAHLIIYRITDTHIEVLDIIHSASSIKKIRNIRNIQI